MALISVKNRTWVHRLSLCREISVSFAMIGLVVSYWECETVVGLNVCPAESRKPSKWEDIRGKPWGNLEVTPGPSCSTGCQCPRGASPEAFSGAFLGSYVVLLSCGRAGGKATFLPMIQFCHFQKTPPALVRRVVTRQCFCFSTFLKTEDWVVRSMKSAFPWIETLPPTLIPPLTVAK